MRIWLVAFALAAAGCADDKPGTPTMLPWRWVSRQPAAALLSVHGTSDHDVWLVGADDGDGPLVLHGGHLGFDRLDTGVHGDLWWVNALPSGPAYFGGTGSLLLRYENGAFEALESPGTPEQTVFGVWAAAEDDVYAVGSSGGNDGFVWHFDGSRFENVELGDTLPADSSGKTPGLFKVWGTSSDEVWVVGAAGSVLRGNARDGFALVASGGDATLFTVYASGQQVVMVGGASAGVLYEVEDGELVDRTPAGAPLLQGVTVARDGTVWAVGFGGSVYRGRLGAFEPVDTGLDFTAAESLHSVWADPEGSVWAVGGDVLTEELDQGLAMRYGPAVVATPDDG
jgi:hypothetical protein